MAGKILLKLLVQHPKMESIRLICSKSSQASHEFVPSSLENSVGSKKTKRCAVSKVNRQLLMPPKHPLFLLCSVQHSFKSINLIFNRSRSKIVGEINASNFPISYTR